MHQTDIFLLLSHITPYFLQLFTTPYLIFCYYLQQNTLYLTFYFQVFPPPYNSSIYWYYVPDSHISTTIISQHTLFSADIYKNSYSALDNYLLLNKGQRAGVRQDFGVITSKGIVGIIENTSNNYATVLSILNRKSRINAQLKSTNHIGSLRWNGVSPEFAQLVDVSKFAPIKVGDTIVTGGQSSIFPKGIGIGMIENFKTDQGGDTYTIEIKLFNDMTNIGHVYIVENLDADEIMTLENEINE